MANEHQRSFVTKRGDWTIQIASEKLPAPVEVAPTRTISDRKFNIRVKQDDICLLDALAKRQGLTRSALINLLLHSIVRDELMSLEEDARTLLAHEADQIASYDELAHPWIYDALSSKYRQVTQLILKYGDVEIHEPSMAQDISRLQEQDYRSSDYIGLRDELKGLSK